MTRHEPRSVTSRCHRALATLAIPLLACALATAAAARPEVPTRAPRDAAAEIAVTPPGEAGEPLVVSGTVYGPEGEPLAGASLFVYQTDAAGIYSAEGNTNPRLKGYLRTDTEGRYRFRTIRPGAYPRGGVPAHIHYHLAPPEGDEETVGEMFFAGDPQLTERAARAPFHHVLEPERGPDGTLRATCDLRLAGGI